MQPVKPTLKRTYATFTLDLDPYHELLEKAHHQSPLGYKRTFFEMADAAGLDSFLVVDFLKKIDADVITVIINEARWMEFAELWKSLSKHIPHSAIYSIFHGFQPEPLEEEVVPPILKVDSFFLGEKVYNNYLSVQERSHPSFQQTLQTIGEAWHRQNIMVCLYFDEPTEEKWNRQLFLFNVTLLSSSSPKTPFWLKSNRIPIRLIYQNGDRDFDKYDLDVECPNNFYQFNHIHDEPLGASHLWRKWTKFDIQSGAKIQKRKFFDVMIICPLVTIDHHENCVEMDHVKMKNHKNVQSLLIQAEYYQSKPTGWVRRKNKITYRSEYGPYNPMSDSFSPLSGGFYRDML